MVYFRGIPVWLKYVPGISFRTDNEPFKVGFASHSHGFSPLIHVLDNLTLPFFILRQQCKVSRRKLSR